MVTNPRKHIRFTDSAIDFVQSASLPLSRRVNNVIDRYREAMRRSQPIEKQFTKAQQKIILSHLSTIDFDPAALIFNNLALELKCSNAPDDLVDLVANLTPFEQVQLVEWIEDNAK